MQAIATRKLQRRHYLVSSNHRVKELYLALPIAKLVSQILQQRLLWTRTRSTFRISSWSTALTSIAWSLQV